MPNWALETWLLLSLLQGKNVIYQEVNNFWNELPKKTKGEKKGTTNTKSICKETFYIAIGF